jgi:hypothetical protein
VDALVETPLLEAKVTLRDRLAVLLTRDVAVLEHGAQHRVAALERALGLVEGVEDRRRLGQAGEERGLGQGQVPRPPREVRLGGCFDPVRVVPEVHLVHVLLEDLVLRPAAVELDRQARLGHLALEGDLPADVEVPDQLLRDRRSALHDLAGPDVGEGGSDDAGDIDPTVLVEAAVLDRQDPLPHPRRDRRKLDRRAVLLGGDRAEERAVRCIDKRVLADRDGAQVVEIAACVDR